MSSQPNQHANLSHPVFACALVITNCCEYVRMFAVLQRGLKTLAYTWFITPDFCHNNTTMV